MYFFFFDHRNCSLDNSTEVFSYAQLLNYFISINREQFYFTHHSDCLVSISKIKTEVVTNTVGIVSSMIDNSFGIVQFKHGNESVKAIFCARTLYKDGFIYDKDPMKLPAISFDG